MRSDSTGWSIRYSRAITSSAACRCRAISIRWRCSPAARRSTAAVDAILDAFAERPFIFNLGHGILPQTPIAHVERMLARVRGT